MKAETTRLSNFEILRTLAMFMIVIWHFYGHNIIHDKFAVPFSLSGIVNYCLSQYIVILCSVAVNIYVMITGYFLIDKDFKVHRIVKVWVETVFYTVSFAVLMYVCGDVQYGSVIKSFMPVRFHAYWFVSCYIGLIIVAPFLSKGVKALSQLQYTKLLLALLLVGTNFIGGYPFGDELGFSWGYSLAWFVVLFFLGGYIKKFDFAWFHRGMLKCFFLIGACVCVFFIIRVLIKYVLFKETVYYTDLHYNSFPIILAIPLFLWFKNCKFKTNLLTKLMVSAAPFTFGVYLIHENEYFNNMLWKDFFDFTQFYDNWLQIPVAIIDSSFVFVACILLDSLRSGIFKWFGINRLENYISIKFDSLARMISERISMQ